MGYMRVKVGQGKNPSKNDTQLTFTSEDDFEITPGGEDAGGVGNWNGTIEVSTDGGDTWSIWDKTQPVSTEGCKQRVGVQGTSTTGVNGNTQFAFTSSSPFGVTIIDRYPGTRTNGFLVSTDGGTTWTTISDISGDGATVYCSSVGGGTIIVKARDGVTVFDGDVSIEAKGALSTGNPKITLSAPGGKSWTGNVTVSIGGSGDLTVWDGSSSIGSGKMCRIDMRGTDNTIITGEPSVETQTGWVVTASKPIIVGGNLAALLGYREVACGRDPLMDPYAFAYLFSRWEKLKTPPELPQGNLSTGCFEGLFFGCTGLKNTPTFPGPDVEIPDGAFRYAFSGSGIVYSAPLPARTVGAHGYSGMFSGCTYLWTQPPINGTAFGTGSCSSMFAYSGIRYAEPPKPAALPAECYQNMYSGCINLWGSAAIVSTVAGVACCAGMFLGCTALLAVPAIGFLAGAAYCLYQCFKGCSSLTDTSGIPDISRADHSMDDIFDDCPLITRIYAPDANHMKCMVMYSYTLRNGNRTNEGYWVVWYQSNTPYGVSVSVQWPYQTRMDGFSIYFGNVCYAIFDTAEAAYAALGNQNTVYQSGNPYLYEVSTSRTGTYSLLEPTWGTVYSTEDTYTKPTLVDIHLNSLNLWLEADLSYDTRTASKLEYGWIEVM